MLKQESFFYNNSVPGKISSLKILVSETFSSQIILYISGGRRRHGRPTLSDILFTLSSAMSLLRRCRVNAALTIQVFSQLFHYINMWIFNKLVLQPQLGLCTRDWGHRLRRRLGRVESWAQKQGLELAADSHLCRVVQVRIWNLSFLCCTAYDI